MYTHGERNHEVILGCYAYWVRPLSLWFERVRPSANVVIGG